MSPLPFILLATLAAGIGSVWIAAGLMRGGVLAGHDAKSRGPGEQHLLSLAAGALLATAFMHLLPEALESRSSAHPLLATLLGGVVFFFLLDKAELWHHGHEHHHGDTGGSKTHAHHGHEDSHAHAHAHDGRDGAHERGVEPHRHESPSRTAGWAVLTGDSVHCFGDGILIASAFMADLRLGVVAAVSVLAHEVPHHIGDLVVLRQSSDRGAAFTKVTLAGAVTPLGGVAGWWLVDRLVEYLPYFLVIASSSFVYVALADLIPQLQKRLGARETFAQVAWLLIGIALVTVVSSLSHAH